MIAKEKFVLQLGHKTGSIIFPRSISAVAPKEQTEHLKKPSLISGIIFEERITIPLIVTN
jgi:hypothetical protein